MKISLEICLFQGRSFSCNCTLNWLIIQIIGRLIDNANNDIWQLLVQLNGGNVLWYTCHKHIFLHEHEQICRYNLNGISMKVCDCDKKATLYSSIKSTAIAHLYYWITLYFCCFSYKKRSEVIWGTHNNTAPVYCHPSAPPQLRHCIVSPNKPTNNKVEDPLFGEMARWGEREERECVSESLNSGPLPGSGIDCRVQRMALTLRYHYSSIDRPALKSKSHLVAQAGVSGSGDHGVCVCVCVCVFICVGLGVRMWKWKCSENVCL